MHVLSYLHTAWVLENYICLLSLVLVWLPASGLSEVTDNCRLTRVLDPPTPTLYWRMFHILFSSNEANVNMIFIGLGTGTCTGCEIIDPEVLGTGRDLKHGSHFD
ncbi:MAG: hypothetical protein NXY57DRAFT_697672 [Lentinula lateritia]|nr:MAG: hypothetical protein NXY57DRAFT_697672 [Lentinula lateritia]